VYTLSARNGDGLAVGMPLMFAGFKIGKISELDLDDRGLVLVSIRVPSQHTKWLRADSAFVLERPLIGSAQLKVVTKNIASPPLSPKTIPMIEEVDDINEAIRKIQPIIEKVGLIADNIERITAQIADPQGDLNKLLRNAEQITEKLAKESLLDVAVGDKESVEAVRASLKHTRAITNRVEIILKKADEELYGKDGVVPKVARILGELSANLAKVGKTLDNVEKISGEAAASSQDLRLLRSELDAAVNSLNNLVTELSRKLPFRSEPKIKLP
ncbi:MAG: MlaD family protein, partial [Syntrophales bacterium]|nr:MlaD family protein [Syntrophales bacterium]